MDENKTSAPEPVLSSGKWIGQLVAAVILAEGIWGLLASVTNNLLVPLLARVMEGDPQSPLYLGKGELNVPAVFRSVLALCLAGIVFVLLHEWSRRKPARARVRTAQVTKKVSTAGPLSITAPPISATPVSATPAAVATSAPTAVARPTAQPAPTQPKPTPQISPPPVSALPASAPVQAKPTPPPVVAPAKPAKPKPPKEVYYNIVGEPINPTEDD